MMSQEVVVMFEESGVRKLSLPLIRGKRHHVAWARRPALLQRRVIQRHKRVGLLAIAPHVPDPRERHVRTSD
jgi:hypothetical protein